MRVTPIVLHSSPHVLDFDFLRPPDGIDVEVEKYAYKSEILLVFAEYVLLVSKLLFFIVFVFRYTQLISRYWSTGNVNFTHFYC